MSTKLVIVESPNKVRSIKGYLGPEFDVEASVGHIRDLAQPSELPAAEKKGPYGKFAVDVGDGFKPYYVVNPDKKKTVTALRKALKEADELYLATDDDREGEAIAWHLKEVLKPKVPVRRMTFTEITQEAVTRALDNTCDLDLDLVDAQETRRILDRLVGYEVSPVLWRKVRAGLSAGRVQSVATRLVVERERERMAFVAAGYWGVEAELAAPSDHGDQVFTARLATLDSRRVATGRDFTDDGQLRPAAVKAGTVHLHEGAAKAIADAVLAGRPEVAEVEDKPYKRRPAAPFTTSTLQQEASRKLRMNPCETMRVAQGLYENGYITYMRTDSTVLSAQAVAAARAQVAELYGPEYVPQRPRVYATKTKGAQEAHEAIRSAGGPLPHPGAGRRRAQRRAVPSLRAHLEAHGGLPDGRRHRYHRHGARGCAPDPSRRRFSRLGRDLPGRRFHGLGHGHHLPRLPGRLRGGARRRALRVRIAGAGQGGRRRRQGCAPARHERG